MRTVSLTPAKPTKASMRTTERKEQFSSALSSARRKERPTSHSFYKVSISQSHKTATRRTLGIANKEPEKETIAASAGSESSQLIGIQNKAETSKIAQRKNKMRRST